MHIGVENGFELAQRVAVHGAALDDFAHDFHVIAPRLRFGVDILDVGVVPLFFFLEPLDALDQQAQLVGRAVAAAGGGAIGVLPTGIADGE